ncbi:MAG TPA: aminoglycoside phosphotransferase family protein [Streptosporangiaceae bacterium]|nr:aminoglycoside phosphotransferase family protein [Streptosporangiaceae bacterium]
MKMHDGELSIDAVLVRRLLAAQFPELARLPVREVRSAGTVNAIYRIGDQLYARLPRLPSWADDLESEQAWLPLLAAGVSLQVPVPVAAGRPAGEFPFRWAIYRWIDGRPYADHLVADELQAAADLAAFVTELRAIPPAPGAPRGGRRPLAELDTETRENIEASRWAIDADAAAAAWDHARTAPAFAGTPVWVHADLLRPNLLVAGGRLRAVLDFGSAGVGDPAADVIAAWSVFGPAGRAAYRAALAADDGAWERARGFALHQAVGIIPYYRETNPEFVAMACRTVDQVLVGA